MQSALEIHWAGLQKPLSQKGVLGSVLQSVLEVQVLILEAEAMEIRPRIIVLNIFGKDLERVPNCGRKRLAVFHDPTTSTLKMQLYCSGYFPVDIARLLQVKLGLSRVPNGYFQAHRGGGQNELSCYNDYQSGLLHVKGL